MTPIHHLAAAGFAFGLGASVGSFLNVCIWRWPRGESVVHPPSHCPRCDAPIAARDNIPLASWLLLRGKCRHCALPISARYPLVEAAAGVLFALVMLAETLAPLDPLERGPLLVLAQLLYHWALAALLLTTALIEHDRRRGRLASSTWTPARSGASLAHRRALTLDLAVTALVLAAMLLALPGDPVGAALNLGLLAVLLRSAR